MSQPANKNPNKSNDNKSYAKSLVGFLSGLVLATLIIVAVLLMINSNSKKTFKPTTEPVLSNSTPPATETLTPSTSNAISASPVQAAQQQDAPPTRENASDIVNKINVQEDGSSPNSNGNTPAPVATQPQPTVSDTAPKANADTRFNEPTFDDDAPLAVAPAKTNVKPREPKPVRNEAPAQANKKPVRTEPKVTRNEAPKTVAKAPKANTAPKPTPQQILDSGNIEKAREAAKNSGSKKGNGVVLQAGSFNSRDYAESQRAKLAMMGVQAQVSEAKVNGKTVYRVQTPKLNAERANDAKAVMRLNGVGVYERSAQ